MPARKKPTFLKRQKELQRVARANEKREARRARKNAKNFDPGDEADASDLDATLEETSGVPDGDPSSNEA